MKTDYLLGREEWQKTEVTWIKQNITPSGPAWTLCDNHILCDLWVSKMGWKKPKLSQVFCQLKDLALKPDWGVVLVRDDQIRPGPKNTCLIKTKLKPPRSWQNTPTTTKGHAIYESIPYMLHAYTHATCIRATCMYVYNAYIRDSIPDVCCQTW